MLIQSDDDNVRFVPESGLDSFQLGIFSRKLTEMKLKHRLDFVCLDNINQSVPEMKGLNIDKKVLMDFIGF